MHVTRFPYWLSLICALLIGWRFWAGRAPATPRRLHQILYQGCALLLLLTLVAYYRNWLGPQVGLAMLALLCGFKILEARQGRDFYLLAYMILFLLLSHFFSNQSIFALLHALAVLFLLCVALFAHNDLEGSLGRPALLAGAGRSLLMAIPIAVLAFLLFPRFPGPLWGRMPNSETAVTGLSETMEPGSIVQVIRSREPVLRAEFHGPAPAQNQLYWRGPVLWQTNGRSWSQGPPAPRGGAARITHLNAPIQYSVVQEGTEQHRLFALELPAHAPAPFRFTPDMQLIAPHKLRSRSRYQITSFVDYRFFDQNADFKWRGLQLPPGSHPRSRVLARQWRQEGLNPRQLIDRALTYFHEQGFVYTLSPRALSGDNMDAFLFETREGFCEHYAAAFVVLMRAAGLPARIVTGYQGGTFNPLGNYYILRQSDAHAWTEVWLDQVGWMRVDPVTAVSPERIRNGMDEVLLSLNPPELLEPLLTPLVAGDWTRSLRNLLDSAGYQWSKWVLGYDIRHQRQLLRLLNLERFGTPALYGLLGAGLFGLLFLLLLILRAGARHAPGGADAARRCYDLFLRRLARAGIRILEYEGPLDCAARAGRLLPGSAPEIEALTKSYIRARYGGERAALAELHRRVHAFRPRPGRTRSTEHDQGLAPRHHNGTE